MQQAEAVQWCTAQLRGNVSVRAATRAEAVQLAGRGFYMISDVGFSSTDPRCEDWNMDLTPARTTGHDLSHVWAFATDDDGGTSVHLVHTDEDAKVMFCDWVAATDEEAAERLRALKFGSDEWDEMLDGWCDNGKDPLDSWALDSFELPLKSC